MSLAVANQYARALLDVVAKPGSALDARAALEQLETFEAHYRESRDLRQLMMTPAIDRVRKHKALDRIGGMLGLDPAVRNFLAVVASHRRAPLLGAIRDSFRTQLDERLGLARALVATARPLDEPDRDALAAVLRQVTGKQILCEYSVQPSLVGGITVKIGSTIYDGSVAGQLGALHRRLTSRQ